MADPVEALRLAQVEGSVANGTVFLENFDVGMVETLGATVELTPDGSPRYMMSVAGVELAPGLPGIPVFFKNPEDAFQRWTVPCFLLSRDSMPVASARRHSAATQYSAPAPHAVTRTLLGRTGPSHRVVRPQASPTDLSYTWEVLAHDREQAALMLQAVLGKFHIDGCMALRDSLGAERLYDAYREGQDPLDDVFDVGDRTIGFSVQVRVEGELDEYPETVVPTVSGALTLRARGR